MRAPIIVVLFAALCLGACTMPKFGMPRVHKITVQQGNVITQEMVDKLKPGMTRNQVRFVIGDPVTRNRFNPDRWDYVYYIDIPGQFHEQKYLSVFFEQDRLTTFTGNFTHSADAQAPSSEVPAEPGTEGPSQETAESVDAATTEEPESTE